MHSPAFRLRLGALSRAVFSLVLIFGVTSPAAAETKAGVRPDNSPVTRGEFLKTSMNTLRFELIHDTKKKPFPHIPPTLLPYVQTADALGALKPFGKTFGAARTITKGEAIQILMVLDGKQNEKPKTVLFSDVKEGTTLQKAVGVAIEHKWMSPKGDGSFGVNTPLTVLEAESLLSRMLKDDSTTITVPVVRFSNKPTSSNLPKEEILRSVWGLVNSDYLYHDRIKEDEAGTNSIEGLLKDLKDPYTVYFPPAKAQNFQNQLQGEITGIGAQVEIQDDLLVIVTPLPGSPAEKAGLQPGDVILSADGKDLKGMGIDEAVSFVRGPKGSTVKLHIKRNGVQFDVSVQRDSIKTLEIQTSTQSNVAVVKLLQFGTAAENDFRQKISEIVAQHPKGIILDLRNNPGGYLEAAGTVSSAFLPKGSTYVTTASKGQTKYDKTELEQIAPDDIKTIVLVNKGSASASEIVAGALQDAGRAKVLGETTFGKGTVQQIWTFDDGSSLKMTIAEWLTPKGRKIDGVGLTPDIVMAGTTGGRDEQLLRAVDLLK
jgi:carboxyl-terminal processing protease